MTLRDSPCYNHLADHLLKLSKTRTLIYVRNPGNWGDALIGAGERAFFKHFSIPYSEIDGTYIFRRSALVSRIKAQSFFPTILYGGNGALSGPYFHLHQRIRLMLMGTVDSIILPSTLPADLSSFRFPKTTHVWRRDNTLSQACTYESRFCHDMAFFLEAPSVETSSEHGNFFREDQEAVKDRSTPHDNFDVSNAGTHQSSIPELFNQIGRYRIINTDRLHVGIAAALMGREVNLFPNNYGKIEAIFRSSIEPNYPNVVFHGQS